MSLSRDELRRRRLQTLCGEKAPDVINLCDSDDEKPTKKRPPLQASDFGRQRIPDSFWGGKVQKTANKVSPSSSMEPDAFQVATYNIWFQVDVHGKTRMNAMADILFEQNNEDLPLLFIGLQEVIQPLNAYLFNRLDDQYRIVQQPRGGVPYYCAIAVHKSLDVVDSGFMRFDVTDMDRGVLWVKAKLPNTKQTILFTTTHLESYTGKNPFTGEVHTGSAERVKQVIEWEAFARSKNCDHTVLTGDWNWDDERIRSQGTDPVLLSHLKYDWKDVWVECCRDLTAAKKKEIQFTYDAKISPMLGGNLRRRFDRILLQGDSNIMDMHLIGKKELPGLQWTKTNPSNQSKKKVPVTPSDHFGLVAQLSVTP